MLVSGNGQYFNSAMSFFYSSRKQKKKKMQIKVKFIIYPVPSIFLFITGVVPNVPLFCCIGDIQCYSCVHSSLCMDDWIWQFLLLLY